MCGKFAVPLILLLLIYFLLPATVSGSLYINEVQIEPKESVEIVNDSSESANLSEWIVDDSGGTTFYTIQKGTLVFAHSCIVIEGSFNLNKASPDVARLLDKSASVAAILQYSKSPGTYISWQRLPDGGDVTVATASSLGLWNSTKETCTQNIPTETPTIPAQAILPTSYPQVEINEVLPNPIEGNEWVELYNPSDQPIVLEDWYLDDEENRGSSPILFSVDIPPHGYEVVHISKNMINNSGDFVRLLSPIKTLIDSVKTAKVPEEETYSRQRESGRWCITEQTPGEPNAPCKEQAVQPEASPNAIATSSLPTLLTTRGTFPTVKLSSHSAVLGTTDGPKQISANVPILSIRLIEALCAVSVFSSLIFALCYTENTDYVFFAQTISSLVHST